MIATLIALIGLKAFSPGSATQAHPTRPRWAVAEFRDGKGGVYGLRASDSFAERWAETKAYEVLGPDVVRSAAQALGFPSPFMGLVNLNQVGKKAIGETYHDGTVVEGDVLDYRIERMPGGRRGRLALRVAAYNMMTSLPVNGTIEVGESPVRTNHVPDENLLNEALQRAVDLAVKTMRSQRMPAATVLSVGASAATINGGTRSGFKLGDQVVVTHGPISLGFARIANIESDRAEIAYEGGFHSNSPGDRVLRVYVLPMTPLPATSILGPIKP